MLSGKNLRKLSDLENRKKDLKRVLDVYLDPREHRKVNFDNSCVTFYAHGIGYDGLPLMIQLDNKGRIYRQWKGVYCYLKLPAETGKVLALLKDMGYALEPIFHSQAVKYNRFVSTGIFSQDS